MQPDSKFLISALQAELQEYGALLHLFERQQTCVLQHDSSGFLAINGEVEVQIDTLTRCRVLRESLVREMATHLRRSAESPLGDLVENFPQAQRPLIHALIDEINNLVRRTRHRAQQNRMLLARCVESARELVAGFRQEPRTKTYSQYGETNDLSISGNTFTPALA